MNQPKFEEIACSGRKGRENACERVTISFGFTSDWMRKCGNWLKYANEVASKVVIAGVHGGKNRAERASRYQFLINTLTALSFLGSIP